MQNITKAILVALVLAGCGSSTKQMYKGKARPKDKVAIVTGYKRTLATTRNKIKIHLRRVDGKDTEGAESVAVLPGPHEFTINLEWYFARISLPRAKVRFRTKAGHKYAIKAFCISPSPSLRADVRFWVTDETDDVVVWGEKPRIKNPMRDTRTH